MLASKKVEAQPAQVRPDSRLRTYTCTRVFLPHWNPPLRATECVAPLSWVTTSPPSLRQQRLPLHSASLTFFTLASLTLFTLVSLPSLDGAHGLLGRRWLGTRETTGLTRKGHEIWSWRQVMSRIWSRGFTRACWRGIRWAPSSGDGRGSSASLHQVCLSPIFDSSLFPSSCPSLLSLPFQIYVDNGGLGRRRGL